MSETEATPRPRRSAREKKQSQQYSTDNSQSPNKRKRLDTDTDVTDEEALSGPEEIPGNESDASEDYVAPRKPVKAPGKATFKPPRSAAPRKPRGGKTAAKNPTRRPRKTGAAKATSGQTASADAKISDDNALFNSIMNQSAALQATVEDFLESFSATPQMALADLINCVLRTCGSNNSVDSDSVVDYDGVVSALDDFTEVLKENEAPTYPLVSKHPMFKKFRKSLSELLSRLIKSSAELGTLYTSDLVITIQAWVVAMSSSQLRSFRHTATVIALEIETALCVVAAAVEKEAETITRQREGERKRKTKGASSAREKDLEQKAADVKDRRLKLADYLKDIFDSVFVHRYRDLDPSIRAECVQAIGKWLKEFPAYFLDGQYLRYIGWVLSDSNTQVRLEAVKSLVPLYGMDDYVVSLQSFTDRFKTRLVEMATSDAELSVRVAVIQVLSSIDRHGLLEEDQRSTLCLLIFDAEPKVRRAVSDFVSGLWEETASERLVGKRKPDEAEKNRAGLKALAHLFVQWGRVLDKKGAEGGDESWDGDSSSQGESSSSQKDISVLVSSRQKGRIGLAVEALWDEIEVISDWETMSDFLLLDHSAGQEDVVDGSPVSAARRKKSRKVASDSLVDEAWRLEEVEEAVLLEILVSSLRKAEMDVVTAAKKSEEPVSSEITRGLIKTLPSLIAKHQTDENRIANVLLIPELMNMDVYLEMRMITAYEALWDDITKQFLSHSSQLVLTNCITAIRHLMSATSLSNTNSTKILELEDELATSLRDVVAGRDELEVSTFSDDEVLALSAICARISSLASIRDLTAWMNEDEGGKQSSAWTIICALAERGRLGYKEEMQMVDRALQLLSVHVIWKSRNVIQNAGTLEDSELQENLREERDILLEKLTEYALGTHSNTLLSVRRTAFHNFLTLQTLFATPPGSDNFPLASLSLSMSDEMQYRCAGFVQAEIERYADEIEGDRPERPTGSDAGSQSESESEVEGKANAPKGKRKKKVDNTESAQPILNKARLEEEYIFTSTIATFLRAIRAGVIHNRHGAVLLTHFGRLGPSFDLSAKILVDILREEGMYRENGALVVETIVQALKDAFTLVIDLVVDSEQHVVALAKAMSSCLIIRGAQLSVVRRLPSQYVIEIHTSLISWIMKRISVYESNKNKKMRARSTLFFRALVQLLVAIEPRDALQIKAHLDHDVSSLKLEVPPTSKSWEPFHAYERRLLSAQGKEKGGKKGKGKALPGAEVVTTDDDDDNEVEGLVVEGLVEANGVSSQVNDAPAPSAPPPKARVRPQPRSVFRKRTAENGPSEDESLHDEDVGISDPGPSVPQVPTTNGRQHSPASTIRSPIEASQEQTQSSNPSPSKKRARTVSDAGSDAVSERSGHDSAAEPTQSGEIIVKRKRVRH